MANLSHHEQSILNELEFLMMKRKRVWIMYQDKKKKNRDEFRYVEPHLIGELLSTGNVELSAWFIPTIEQAEQYGDKQGWRLYELDNISEVRDTDPNDIMTRTRPNYNRDDQRMRAIYCNI
jgi:hypothetical protein